MVPSPEVSKLAEGIAHDEETRANWRPDPEMLAAASEPKRRVLKTEMGMVAVRPAAGSAPTPSLSDGAGSDNAQEPAQKGATLPLAEPLAAGNAPRHAPEGGPKQYRTFLGIAMPGLAQGPTPGSPTHEPALAPTHGPVAAHGLAAAHGPGPAHSPAGAHSPAAAHVPPRGPAAGAAAPAEAPPRVVPLGTLLGVATPGIAPVLPPPAGASPVENAAPGAPLAARSNRTLLGVSGPAAREPGALPEAPVPGALTAAFKIPEVLPAPARPHREALPEVPDLQPKRGIPMAPVVGGIAVALGLGGIALFFALKSGPPLTAQGRVDETGKEALSIHCPSCPDGTKLTLRGAGVEVKGGQAILPLADPLALGPNVFEVGIDRPAGGRDETVKLSVPVSYRVRADLGSLDADPPAIVVRAEAVEGSTVEVDGKPVVLSGGKGQAVLPLGDEVVGPSDDAKVVDRSVTFKVTLPSPARPESGTLPVRVRIVPLHLDAPGAHAVVAGGGSCRFTGQTVVGGKLTVNGASTTLGTRGEFATDVLCTDVGPQDRKSVV